MSPSIDTTEYALTIKSVKRFKNLLLLLFLAMLLVQAAAFVLMEFTSVLDMTTTEQGLAVETDDADSTSVAVEVETKTTFLHPTWSGVLQWLLPATKFFALVFGGLLALVLMTGVKISLLGHIAGTRKFLKAFFWSLILLAMVVPWQQVYHGTVVCGALYSLGELLRGYNAYHTLAQPTTMDTVFYYARFLAYPAVVLLVWLLVAIRSAGASPVPAEVQATK